MGIPLFANKFIDLFFRNKRCVKFGKESPYWIIPQFSEKPIIYSAGVGKDISFELDLQKAYNADIFLFDPSPTGKRTMKSIRNKSIRFFKKGIAEKSTVYSFSLPRKKEEGSYSISRNRSRNSFECVSISDFFKKMKHSKINLLKMDIEGFEYGVIADILKNKIPVEQIVLEFHHFLRGISYVKTIRAIRLLRYAGYKLVYKDVDNFTFIR